MGTVRMTCRPRVVLALTALAAGFLAPDPARAWYFPEHAEMTRLALQDFASCRPATGLLQLGRQLDR
jgi:hypothetical protein